MPNKAKNKATLHLNVEAMKKIDTSKEKHPLSERERISHMLEFHLQEMTEWEVNFCYSNKEWLSRRPENYLTDKTAKKLKEIEDEHCGSICHALNKTGVRHG